MRARRLAAVTLLLSLSCAPPADDWTSDAEPGALEQGLSFSLGSQGCPMAHCDGRMSDRVNLTPPLSAATAVRWHDTAPNGSSIGLGCSSNGTVVACTYKHGLLDNLVVYGAHGFRRWSSGLHLNSDAYASAAMVSPSGDVIAADTDHVVAFNPSGSVAWKTPTPGGLPISPVLLSNGAVVLATKGGPVSAYRSSDGALIGSLSLQDSPGSEYYDTQNTPCVSGNRVYVSTEKRNDAAHTGRLFAIDVDPAASPPLQVRWSYAFGGPSGASPLRIGNVIYFDGDRPAPGAPFDPHLFAVRDTGTSGQLVWMKAMEGQIAASAAEDPRGGLWVFGVLRRHLIRYHPDTGAELQRVDLDALMAEPGIHTPSSAMSIAGSSSQPVMIVGAVTAMSSDPSWVVGIDLVPGTRLWKAMLAPARSTDWTAAQFAIARTTLGKPYVVFPGNYSGAYGVAEP